MKESVFKLQERDVVKQCRDYLSIRGWRPLRNQVSKVQNAAGGWFVTGEKGMPDHLFLYYMRHSRPGMAVALWVEFKAQGKQLRTEQVDWQRKELARGALVLKVDHYETFEKQYEELFGWLHQEEGQSEFRFR